MDFKSLKKANFHLHITGALNPEDLRRIARVCRFNISGFELLEKHMSFFDPEIWTVAKELTSTNVGLLESIKTILKRESEDNVIYVELTINPAGMLRRGMTNKDMVKIIIKGLEFGETLCIKCKIKFGVNRKDGPESVKIVRKIFESLPKEHRAFIDLNGDEKKFPTSNFVEAFRELVLAGIPVSIHAGEFSGMEESLQDALKINPSRVAHALMAVNNEKFLLMIKEQGIQIESSPISNIKTGVIKKLEDHPIKKFIEYKIPVLLGSDDPAIFNTNMTKELKSLEDVGFQEEEIIKLSNL